MNRLSLTLSGVLLATSALIAPGLAFAQAAPETAPTAQNPAQMSILDHTMGTGPKSIRP